MTNFTNNTSLNISKKNTNTYLAYSANYPGRNLVLQNTTNLADTTSWQTVATPTTIANGKIQTYNIDSSKEVEFFRLILPVDRSPLITDSNLEDAIRANLGLTNQEPLTEKQLSSISTLKLANLNIQSLEGIQYLAKLTNISLKGNPITDYTLLQTKNNDIATLYSIKNLLINNNRDHFANTDTPFYVKANTIDSSVQGTLVRYAHSSYLGNIHTEGQWYAGFLLAHQATTTPLTAEQQTLLNDIIIAGTTYFPYLKINGQSTTLQGWTKNDQTSAADADIFKIMTLFLSGRKIEAQKCSDDFFKYETKTIQDLIIPLCGVNDTDIKVIDSPFYTKKGDQTIFLWNPSYSYSYASNLLKELSPNWSILQHSQHLINSKILDKYGLIDWCVVLINNNTGEINVSLNLDHYFPRTKIDSFHVNQIFSNPHYTTNLKNLGIYKEDSNGYLTYTANATTTIDALLNNLSSAPENEQTIKALTFIRQNSIQKFPGRGENINLTKQKEWPRFIMDHLMNYAKYNDAYSLETLNLLKEKHGENLNLHPIHLRYQELLRGAPANEPDDQIILAIASIINKNNVNEENPELTPLLYQNGLLYHEWANEIVHAIRAGLKATFNNLSPNDVNEFKLQVLSNQLGNIAYGNPWDECSDWTFNQFIVGFIVNTILEKIKLPL